MNPQPTVITKKESAMGKIVPLLPNSHKEIGALSLSELNCFRKRGWWQWGGGSCWREGHISFLLPGWMDTCQKQPEEGGRRESLFDSWFEGIQAGRQGYEPMMADAYAGLFMFWSPKSRKTDAGIRAGL